MTELIPPNPAALAEALELSEQILRTSSLRTFLSHISPSRQAASPG